MTGPRSGVALACVFGLVAASCIPFISGDEPLTPLALAQVAGSGPAGIDSIWLGYSPLDEGFLLYEAGKSALLVTSDAPPEGFTAVADSLLPARLQGVTYRHQNGLPGLEGGTQTEHRIGEIVTTAYSPGSSLSESLAALYHEVFHRYQQRTFAGDRESDQYVDPELLTREFVAAAQVERRILARALEFTPGAELDSLLRRFLAVRHERLGSLPSRVREVERAMERREGSANLVGLELAAATLEAEPEHVEDAVTEYLTVPLDRFGGSLSTRLIRWRAYGTGAAMGLLLERKGAAWRRPLEDGRSFDALLAQAVAPDSSWSPALARQAFREFGYDDLLEGLGDTPSPKEELEAFYGQAPVRFVVEVLPEDTAAYESKVSFNFSYGFWEWILRRRHGMSQPGRGLTLIWDPDVLHITNPERAGFNFRVEGRPTAIDLRDRGKSVRYVVMLPALPDVRGREPGPGRREYPDGVEIHGEGTLFRTDLAVEVIVSGADSIRVRISPEERPPAGEESTAARSRLSSTPFPGSRKTKPRRSKRIWNEPDGSSARRRERMLGSPDRRLGARRPRTP